jgi:hypothetical protein
MDELQITDTAQSDRIQVEIDRASALICSYLNVQSANDATVTLGRETLVETIDPSPPGRALYPSRRPIVSVSGITESGTVIDSANYAVSYNCITRVQNTVVLPYWWMSWGCQSVVIEYVAGWLLPNDSGRNLPLEIEAACIGLVKALRFSRVRDPMLRSENFVEGLYSYTLFDPTKITNTIPPDIASTIDQYRNVYV